MKCMMKALELTFLSIIFASTFVLLFITRNNFYGKKFSTRSLLTQNGSILNASSQQAQIQQNYVQTANLHVRGKILQHRSQPQQKQDNRPIVSICLSTTSRKQTWKSIHDTCLVSGLLPSIYDTISTAEFNQYRVRVYIAYDSDDRFWLRNAKKVVDLFATVGNKSLDDIVFNAFKPTKRIPFNEILSLAYDEGAEYLVRINDDTRFFSKGWIPLAIAELRKLGNVGMVGPDCPDGSQYILTHDMTHRTHMHIFNQSYYPILFTNVWLDDWITQIYRPDRSIRMKNWVVRHDVHKHGTRYNVDWEVFKQLPKSVADGKRKITQFLMKYPARLR